MQHSVDLRNIADPFAFDLHAFPNHRLLRDNDLLRTYSQADSPSILGKNRFALDRQRLV